MTLALMEAARDDLAAFYCDRPHLKLGAGRRSRPAARRTMTGFIHASDPGWKPPALLRVRET
ncbi:hypothetical protein ACIKTA_12640, partial [Hansschlegelia beijingensis]